MAAGLERRAIGRAKRSTVFIEIHISGRQAPAGIEGDDCFLKIVIIQQEREIFIAVKSGISGKDAVMGIRVNSLKIKQNRFK